MHTQQHPVAHMSSEDDHRRKDADAVVHDPVQPGYTVLEGWELKVNIGEFCSQRQLQV